MKIVHKETSKNYPELRGATTSQLASLISTKSKAPFKDIKQKLSRNLHYNHRVLKIARKLGPAIEDALKEIQTALDDIRLKRQSKNDSRQLTSPLTTTETLVSLSQSQAVETNGFYCDICGADDWHDCPHDDIPSTQNELDEIRLKGQSKKDSRQLTSPLTTTKTSVSTLKVEPLVVENDGFYCDICGADDWHDCPHDDIPSTQNDQNLMQKVTELQLSKDYSDDLDICQTQKFDISTHKHPLTKIAIKFLPERVGKIILFDNDTDSE